MMGSPRTERGRFNDEDLHPVTLSQGFWLAETAVTQDLWQAVMGENPSRFNGDNQPVETVGWNYACRAGRQTPFNFADELTLAKVSYRGTWEFETDEWGQGAKRETAEVKSYPCNDWGLYEMHGNVLEWCEDAWQKHLGHGAEQDPWQQSVAVPGAARVARGGFWGNYGSLVRSAIRYGSRPGSSGRPCWLRRVG